MAWFWVSMLVFRGVWHLKSLSVESWKWIVSWSQKPIQVNVILNPVCPLLRGFKRKCYFNSKPIGTENQPTCFEGTLICDLVVDTQRFVISHSNSKSTCSIGSVHLQRVKMFQPVMLVYQSVCTPNARLERWCDRKTILFFWGRGKFSWATPGSSRCTYGAPI